jgi:FtsP/CotA-like multicopper oxidase with cupredoxin domain/peroxiredoxin
MAEEWGRGNDYTLRVQKCIVALPGAGEEGGPEKIEMIAYNGRLVGPTIRIRRGTTFRINLVNELPPTDEPGVVGEPNQEDRPHGLYTTNLHTHGLHVSPAGDSDDVFREIPPGGSFQYNFTVPADHPSGTFWYHPHKHGSVAYQIANGMAGALIVAGDGHHGKGRDLEDIPEIAGARERVCVLQQLILRKDRDGIGRVDPNDVYPETPRPDAYQATAINGVVMPTYTMQPGEVQRWRFIHGGREEPIELQWRNEKQAPVRTMPFREIAVDGLATGTLKARKTVRLYPGQRSDVLIKAPAETGTYYLATELEQEGGPAPAPSKDPIRRLARLVIAGPAKDMRLPSAGQLAACKPFEPVDPTECKIKRDVVFNHDDRAKVFHVNGASFGNQTSLDKPVLGSAEEWTLTAENAPNASNDPHPFHIHVNPFQVVQCEDLATHQVTKRDEWRDTVVVEPGKKLTVRMRFRDFSGKTVLHCHTLDHEDQGMMRTIHIVDPKQPDAGSEDTTKLTDCRIPAPALTLPTAEKSSWELSALRQQTVVLVFFRGTGCLHCMRRLRGLLQEARDLPGTDSAIVAVSSEPIADLDKAIRSLNVPPGLAFSLLVDEAQRGFREFGCYREGPQHGLFIIDKAGTIRAKYVGDVPMDDVQAAYLRVRQLLAEGQERP